MKTEHVILVAGNRLHLETILIEANSETSVTYRQYVNVGGNVGRTNPDGMSTEGQYCLMLLRMASVDLSGQAKCALADRCTIRWLNAVTN